MGEGDFTVALLPPTYIFLWCVCGAVFVIMVINQITQRKFIFPFFAVTEEENLFNQPARVIRDLL